MGHIYNLPVVNKNTHTNFENSCSDFCFSLVMVNFYIDLHSLKISGFSASVGFTFSLSSGEFTIKKFGTVPPKHHVLRHLGSDERQVNRFFVYSGRYASDMKVMMTLM